jgi:hypothetical protein
MNFMRLVMFALADMGQNERTPLVLGLCLIMRAARKPLLLTGDFTNYFGKALRLAVVGAMAIFRQ